MKSGYSLRCVVSSLLFLIAIPALFCQVRLVSPQATEIYYHGIDTVHIRWDGVDSNDYVRISYSFDDGRRWTVLADSATGHYYAWMPDSEAMVSSTYRMRVEHVRQLSPTDDVVYTSHAAPVNTAHWSPDAYRIVSGSMQAHVWDSWSARTIKVLSSPEDRIESVAWSRDTSMIAAGSWDNVAYIFDATTYEDKTLFTGQTDAVSNVVFDTSSRRLVVASEDRRVRVYDISTGGQTAQSVATQRINFIAVNNGNTHCAASSEGNTIQLVPLGGGSVASVQGSIYGTLHVAWSNDDTRLFAVLGSSSVKCYDVASRQTLWEQTFPGAQGVRWMSVDPYNRYLAVAHADTSWSLLDYTTGAVLQTYGGLIGGGRQIDFSPDGRDIAVTTGSGLCSFFEVATMKLHRNTIHSATVNGVEWSPDGSRALTYSEDGTVRVWSIRPVAISRDWTKGPFSIATAPPASLKFNTTGATVMIGDTVELHLDVTATGFIPQSRATDLILVLNYNAAILDFLGSSLVDSAAGPLSSRKLFLKSMPIPKSPGRLASFRFVATLGMDSLTSLRVVDAKILNSVAAFIYGESAQDILVRGICRAGGTSRLYNSLGSVNSIVARQNFPGETSIIVTTASAEPAHVRVFDFSGRVLYECRSLSNEVIARTLERRIPNSELASPLVFINVTTESWSWSIPHLVGGR